MSDDESKGSEQPIVIKKIVKGGGHHGGAWKVAYADFVTAMMAFFLLMWLLNMATQEQLEGIADYFSPTTVSSENSGAGGVMGGMTISPEGAQTSDKTPPTPPPTDPSAMGSSIRDPATAAEINDLEQAKEELRNAEETEMKKVQNALEQAMQENPELADLAENLLVDMTPEGLRIQVVDAEGKPMFPSGSARMYEKTKLLMEQVGKAIESAPNELSIRGHTDSIPYGAGATYTNWELSSDRANSSRRVLQESGIAQERLNNVVGKADTEHLVPEDPTNARNRRISIVLLREELTDPEAYQKRAEELAKQRAAKNTQENAPSAPQTEGIPTSPTQAPAIPEPETGDFRKTDGDVQFP